MSTPEHAVGQMSITLGGKDYALFFDYTFVSILQNMFGNQTMEQALKKEPLRLIPSITLAAIQSGADVNDLTETLTERQVSRLLFAAGPEVNKAIYDNYTASMGFIGAVYAQTAKVVSEVDKAKSTK